MKTQLNHLLFILFVAFINNSSENTIKLSLLFYFFQFMYFLRAVFFSFKILCSNYIIQTPLQGFLDYTN